ncbi:MAG: hypothetical protein OXC05_01060 [Halieaceae bacterium]|nr:hypothetical protein [Halieaceae bacterium]
MVTVVLALLMVSGTVLAQYVYIAHDATLAEAEYASRKLTNALESQGYSVVGSARDYDYLISVSVGGYRLEKEAFTIIPEGRILSVYGGDGRGMIYGVLGDQVIDVTRPIYRDMLLTHMIGSSKNLNPDGLFHWEMIRPQVAKDVRVVRNAVSGVRE